jgi:hypothetical protein
MRKIVLVAENNWVKFHDLRNITVSNAIRNQIKPLSYRRYDVQEQCWYVYWSQLRKLVAILRRVYQIDTSELPEQWQHLLDGMLVNESVRTLTLAEAYAELYLNTDAPIEVVKAVYKILAQVYHPDRGDSTDRMSKINAAYQFICSSCNSE